MLNWLRIDLLGVSSSGLKWLFDGLVIDFMILVAWFGREFGMVDLFHRYVGVHGFVADFRLLRVPIRLIESEARGHAEARLVLGEVELR